MTDSNPREPELQLEIIELLDKQFRLREDPKRRTDLQNIRGRLRDILRERPDDKTATSDG